MKQLLGRGRRVRVQRYVMSVALLVPLLLSLRADSNLSVLPATGAQVYGFGDALVFGPLNSLVAPIVGMAVTPSGAGYFLVGADGGVFAFGDAVFRGSMGGGALAAPIVGMAVTPSGDGYYLSGADGGVFAFGSATYSGGPAANAGPIVAIAATANGYLLVAQTFSVPPLPQPVPADLPTPPTSVEPPTTVTPSESIVPPTTSATTPTTAPPLTATTAPPTTTGFPVETNTGVPSGIVLRPWSGPDRSSAVTGLPTEAIGGVTYKVFDGYIFDTGTTGQYFSVDDPNVLFRNVRFTTSGQVSNTSAMLQQASSNQSLVIEDSEFDGGPYHQRGVQGDYGNITVRRSRFTRFGNAGVEMNNRSGGASLTVEDSYFYEPQGWNPSDHVDGIQVGAGGNVTIRHNTVLIEPYGGAAGDTSYVSNSALGLWAELGDVTGLVVVDHNLLAGGGYVIYLEQKSPYQWQGPVSVTNNVFDTRFGPNGGIWGPLYPSGLPSQLVWSGNTWTNGASLTLQQATTQYP